MMTVGQLLKSKGSQVWSVAPDATLRKAIQLLAAQDIGAVLVLEEGKVMGIFSERDFTRRSAAGRGCSLDDPVESMMTHPVFTIRPEQTLEECMAIMTQKHFRHLPVVDSGELVGLISIGDVVKAMMSELHLAIEGLQNYIIREEKET